MIGMKKWLGFTAVMVMAVLLCGCGGNTREESIVTEDNKTEITEGMKK